MRGWVYCLVMERIIKYSSFAVLLGILVTSITPAFSASPPGRVIWEGTENGKILVITSLGVFKNGKFTKAEWLNDTDKCRYGMTNFPKYSSAFMPTERAKSKEWDRALSGLDFVRCRDIRTSYSLRYDVKQTSVVTRSSGAEQTALSSDSRICALATKKNGSVWTWHTDSENYPFVIEAKRRNLACKVNSASRTPSTASVVTRSSGAEQIALSSDSRICALATKKNGSVWTWHTDSENYPFVIEARQRGLNCNVSELRSTIAQTKIPKATIETYEIRLLKDRLAKLEAEKNATQQTITQDTQSPSIRITSADSDGARGTITGTATDNTGIAEVLIDGQAVAVDSSGRFTTSTFIPSTGIDVQITAYDLKGLSTTETVRLERSKRTQQVSRLAAANPLVGPKQETSRDRAALIIGLEKYEASAPAQFASRDAQMFADYAREKLGIPAGNVKVLTDSGASEREILTALKVWLPTAVKPDTTDLYVFYAGHGMPTADGSSAYLVPYDGDVRLLEDTAISRKRFFDEIGAAKPRSATFFFDNCYSGATRSEELLLASRPLSIKVEETEVPDNYLVFTAGESNQTAGVLDEVKHGRFSYFVFKGLEGEADTNSDGKISAGELHAYVRESVGRFSAGAQTPTMLGDAGRWVLR